MANWYDIGDVGPDTDPEPLQEDGDFDDLHNQDAFWDGLLDDAANQREPGVGEEYNGEDPSIWSTQGEAEEPTVQEDAVPPTFIQEWAEQENRQRALLRLRGIHIPDERTDVNPDTGEILTQDTDPILTWEESVADLQSLLPPIFPGTPESTPPAVPPAIPSGQVWELPAGQIADSMQVVVPDPVADAVLTPVDVEVEATRPEEAESLSPDDEVEIGITAKALLDDILDVLDSRDRAEYLVDKYNQDTISQLSQLVSAAQNAEYPSVSMRNVEYFMRGYRNGIFQEFDASPYNDDIADLIIEGDSRVDDLDNDILDLTVPSQLFDFSDVIGGVDQDTTLTEFNLLGGLDDDDLL